MNWRGRNGVAAPDTTAIRDHVKVTGERVKKRLNELVTIMAKAASSIESAELAFTIVILLMEAKDRCVGNQFEALARNQSGIE